MKIETNTPNIPLPTFESIPDGGVFIDENGWTMMKLNGMYIEEDGSHWNAVDLDDGALHLFAEDDEVQPLPNAVLKVNG